MMRIAVLGYGRMGAWLVQELLSEQLTVAVYDPYKDSKDFCAGVAPLYSLEQLKEFKPDLLINAASLKNAVQAFTQTLDSISSTCILADIASIKEELSDFYRRAKREFVSVHPMFGPTFARLNALESQNAIVINESCAHGREFFEKLFGRLKLRIVCMSFAEHDSMMAYSLSVPFFCSLLFADAFSRANVPGSTFAKHLEVARGLLNEDPDLILGVLSSQTSLEKLNDLTNQARALLQLVAAQEQDVFTDYMASLKAKICQ